VVKGGGVRGDVGEELHHRQITEKFQKYKTLIIQLSSYFLKYFINFT
jgi:hypothetical protein